MKEYFKLFADMWKSDYQFKTVSSAALSALIGCGFTIFNGILGIIYGSLWNGSICVYYVLLAIVRGTIVNSQRKTDGRDPKKGRRKRKKIYIKTHIILLVIDLALIAPIEFMVLGDRSYSYGMVPAIAMAAYTTYRVAMGIIHFKKSGREENILVKELRLINLQDSLVSVLTLQNALIIASGDGMRSMMQLTVWTSGGIWLIILFFTVRSFLSVKKY